MLRGLITRREKCLEMKFRQSDIGGRRKTIRLTIGCGKRWNDSTSAETICLGLRLQCAGFAVHWWNSGRVTTLSG
jgi:hypothetical protein